MLMPAKKSDNIWVRASDHEQLRTETALIDQETGVASVVITMRHGQCVSADAQLRGPSTSCDFHHQDATSS